MRDEDLDWSIYHVLLEGKACSLLGLSCLGYEPRLIEESVHRLEKYHLVEREGESVRVLSFQESLFLCRAKNDETCPFIVENGIIRARTEQERKT